MLTPSVATMLAEGRSAGLEAVLCLAVLGPDPRRARALRRALAAAVDLDLPHARDRRRPLARRAGDGRLLRPHLDRPGKNRNGCASRPTTSSTCPSTPPSTSGSPEAPRAPPSSPARCRWRSSTTRQLAEHHLAAQRDRGGHHLAHLAAPLGDKRSARPPADQSRARGRPEPRSDPSRRRAARPTDGADRGSGPAAARGPVAMLPDSYTAAHRYDGAIIQRQRCDDPEPCRAAPARPRHRARRLALPLPHHRPAPRALVARQDPSRPRAAGSSSSSAPATSSASGPTARAAPTNGPTTSAAAGHRLLRELGVDRPRRALQTTRRLRLRPRPPRHPAQRLGARLPPPARHRAARLARRTPTHPAPNSPPSPAARSTTTGPSKASATPSRDRSSPTPPSRSPTTAAESPRPFLIEYDRTSRIDKNYDKFRRYDTFLAWWWRHTQLARPRRRRPSSSSSARTTPNATTSSRAPTTNSPATAGTPATPPSSTNTSAAGASSSATNATSTTASSKRAACPRTRPDTPPATAATPRSARPTCRDSPSPEQSGSPDCAEEVESAASGRMTRIPGPTTGDRATRRGALLTAGEVAQLLGVPRTLGVRAVACWTDSDRQAGALPPLSPGGHRAVASGARGGGACHHEPLARRRLFSLSASCGRHGPVMLSRRG